MKTIQVQGMHCPRCQASVKAAVEQVAGVRSCTVDLAGGKVSYEEDAPVSAEALKAAIEGIGFDVVGEPA